MFGRERTGGTRAAATRRRGKELLTEVLNYEHPKGTAGEREGNNWGSKWRIEKAQNTVELHLLIFNPVPKL